MNSCIVYCIFLSICAFASVSGLPPRLKLSRPHIVGGEETEIENIPYQVSVRKYLSHFCGASIISKEYVLSAAHCFHNRHWIVYYGLRAGSTFINQGKYHFIRSIVSHEKFDVHTTDYDVAIIRIWFGFDFDQRTAPVPIVKAGEHLAPGTKLVVSGWGKTRAYAEDLPDKLRKTEVFAIVHKKCKIDHDEDEVTERMFCAGVSNGCNDACTGDSGGPIVNVATGEQAGLVSWGAGCGDPTKPGVYTDLSHPEIRLFIVNNSDL